MKLELIKHEKVVDTIIDVTYKKSRWFSEDEVITLQSGFCGISWSDPEDPHRKVSETERRWLQKIWQSCAKERLNAIKKEIAELSEECR